MLRWARFLIVPAILCWLLAATTADDCSDKLAACVKANNCAKTPDSKACKDCKAAHSKCAEGALLRASPKKTLKVNK